MPSEKTEPKIKVSGSDGYSMNDTIRKLYADDLNEKEKKPLLSSLKRPAVFVAISILAVFVFLGFFVHGYNMFMTVEENVFSSTGHIQAELQRRQNLFNNLVNLVLDYAAFEKEVFEHVTQMRNSLKDAQAMIGQKEGEPAAEAAVNPQAINGLQKAMSQLMAVVERYPDLKANEVYRTLIEKLVETENRIATRRGECNESVRIYNVKVATVPWVWIAMIFGFHEMDYFKVEKGIVGHENPLVKPDMFKKLVPQK